MSYSVETIDNCTKKLIFNYENADLGKSIDDALKQKQKNAQIKGFRKGKAPMSMIKAMYAYEVENEAFSRFASEKLFEAMNEEKIFAVGQPMLSNTKYDVVENEENKRKISFEATVEVYPDFEVKDYSGLSFDRESDQVSDEDHEKVIKGQLESKAQILEIKDENVAIEKGHHVVFNFEGEKEDGEKPENMKGSEYLLEIGSGQFIPGFEDGLIGLKKGEKKTLDLTFPENYQEESLQNAKVKFHVEILEIKNKVFPDLTDELAKELGFESVEDMKDKTLARLKFEKKMHVERTLNEEILKKLDEMHEFKIPATMVQRQKEHMFNDRASGLKAQGFPENLIEQFKDKMMEEISKEAESQLKRGLILNKIKDDNSIKANDEDVETKFKEMTFGNEKDYEELKSYYTSNTQAYENFKMTLDEEKVLNFIREKLTINQK